MNQMDPVMQSLFKAILEGEKVIVGGAPLSQAFTQRIGEDGFSPYASRGVALAKTLLANQEVS